MAECRNKVRIVVLVSKSPSPPSARGVIGASRTVSIIYILLFLLTEGNADDEEESGGGERRQQGRTAWSELTPRVHSC